MKKMITFVFCAMMATMAVAQINTNAKINLVVGQFSGDYSMRMRGNVISELCNSHRANVIEQQVYNALPQSVRDKMHIDAVITGNCSLKTERKENSYTDRNGNKKTEVRYESKMTTVLTFTDPERNVSLMKPEFSYSASEEKHDESIEKAIHLGSTSGKRMALLLVQTLTLDEFLQERYPIKGQVATLVESKKNKAEVVTINLGSRDAVYRGQTFEIVGPKKNYGRLRVREINGESMATCAVEEKGKEIFTAISEGTTLEVVNYVQAINLNGIVRVAQDAPKLSVSSPDDSKRRNVAFGTVVGGAPVAFVEDVQKNLASNHRVNAYTMGASNCPDLNSLDGIVYGYFEGMNTTSKLVKADEHIFQLKDYTEYTTVVKWYAFIVNPTTGEIVYSGNRNMRHTSSESQKDAEEMAMFYAANLSSATYKAYPIIGNITTLDEGDQTKAKKVSIDLGSNYPVYKGLELDVYSQNISGDWENIGRIEVADIVDATHSSCDVKKGDEAIRKAIEDNLPMRVTSDLLKGLLD